jgi:predicted RNase H-like nuclease
MASVLGIDAAWTEKEPSGVALLEGSPEGWRCVAVAPSYDSFLSLAEGTPVDWTSKARGTVPNVDRVLSGAERLLVNQKVSAVTVDMPLSTEPITGRREADAAISRAYGGRGAAVHSPSAERPGAISDGLSRGFAAAGFPLATSTTPVGTPNRLVEVYPHPALITLIAADYRLPYKVSRSRRYWPGSSPAERKANLLTQFGGIASALNGEIRDIPIELPGPDSMVSTSGLKRYEDSLDALVCAWVGAKYLEGEAVPTTATTPPPSGYHSRY